MAGHGDVQTDDGVHCAFFYGTLMVPDVFYSVCYGGKDVPEAIAKLHTFRPAVLHGYSRRRVKHADYPGIVEAEGHEVLGTFVTGLTRANMAKLDYFEGSEYERRTVAVRLLEKVGDAKGEGRVEAEERTAEVYVFLNPDALEDGEWDVNEFCRKRLRFWARAGYVFEDYDPDNPAKIDGQSQRGE